jgi:cyclophilin family peptidyl-prolyl cis-trans isomerase
MTLKAVLALLGLAVTAIAKSEDPFNVEFSVNLAPGKVDSFVITVHPEWAPLGAARFKELVDNSDFFQGVRFFRTIKGFMTQVTRNWKLAPFLHFQTPSESSTWRIEKAVHYLADLKLMWCMFAGSHLCSLVFLVHQVLLPRGGTARFLTTQWSEATSVVIYRLPHQEKILAPRKFVFALVSVLLMIGVVRAPSRSGLQMFINLADNPNLDGMGFSPFAQVTKGMEVVDKIYDGSEERQGMWRLTVNNCRSVSGYSLSPFLTGYGEGGVGDGSDGKGPSQGRLQEEGNRYLKKVFPRLSYIVSARIIPDSKTDL